MGARFPPVRMGRVGFLRRLLWQILGEAQEPWTHPASRFATNASAASDLPARTNHSVQPCKWGRRAKCSRSPRGCAGSRWPGLGRSSPAFLLRTEAGDHTTSRGLISRCTEMHSLSCFPRGELLARSATPIHTYRVPPQPWDRLLPQPYAPTPIPVPGSWPCQPCRLPRRGYARSQHPDHLSSLSSRPLALYELPCPCTEGMLEGQLRRAGQRLTLQASLVWTRAGEEMPSPALAQPHPLLRARSRGAFRTAAAERPPS